MCKHHPLRSRLLISDIPAPQPERVPAGPTIDGCIGRAGRKIQVAPPGQHPVTPVSSVVRAEPGPS